MRKFFEHLLLAMLVCTTVLLGLTFWLNTNFGFNLLSAEHWNTLASLQASGQQIDKQFYVSIGAALLILFVCLNIIYRPGFKKQKKQTPTPIPTPVSHIQIIPTKADTSTNTLLTPPTAPATPNEIPIVTETTPIEKQDQPVPVPTNIPLTRPPRLHLPKNMAQVAATQHAQQMQNAPAPTDRYDSELKQIFADNSFVVKKNPRIAGFVPNLFAIGGGEIIWIGGVDCDIAKLNTAIKKLESTFQETLEDIVITINAFIIDTTGKYNSDEHVQIFHDIDELKQYISQNPGVPIDDSDREDFDAYSDYIDTVLTLLYKI